jgi:hypothetical protein
MSNEESGDNFAEQVFDNEVGGIELPSEGSLDSWDDAESHVAPEPSNESIEADNKSSEEDSSSNSESNEAANSEDGESTFETEDKADSEKPEAPEEEVGEAESEEADSEASEETDFEIPEQLQEKGLVANEDGDFGKVIKVDGEDTFVSLEELGNDYSGQKAIAQRFNELATEKRGYQQEVEEVNSYVNTFASKMKEEGALAGMQYLGEFSGMAPYQIKRQLVEALQPEIERMYNMSATELNAEYAQEENEYLKQSIESERETFQAQQARQELDAEVNSVRETQGIDDSEWNQALSFLTEHEQSLREANPNLVMDANYVAETVMDARAYTRADTAFNASDVNLSDEQSGEVMNYLHDVAFRNPDFTQEDLVELVRSAEKSAIESKVSKDLGNRIKKSDSVSSTPQAKQTQTETSPQEDAILEDIWG